VSVGAKLGKLAVSIPVGVTGMIYELNPSCLIADLYSTQPLTEMRSREIS